MAASPVRAQVRQPIEGALPWTCRGILLHFAPVLFRGVWRLICPWFDDKLVGDVEGGIDYLNGMKLCVGPVRKN